MGLYDNYQLANSSKIKEYQGSTVPELVKVNQELQARYDTAVEGQDYIARFMGSMSALPQDKKALREMAGTYQDRLKQLSARPDLENSLRETTMLGRDVPEAYAPFAQRVKDFSDRKEQISKDVAAGNITLETAQRLLQRDLHRDQGLTKDPMTGRYTGRFSGQDYTKDLNVSDKVDEWMEGNVPQTLGYTTEKVNGEWIIKQGGKTVTRNADVIRQIINAGAAADSEFQGWVRQKVDLDTFDYEANPNTADLSTPMGSIRQKNGKKEKIIPVTLQDVLEQYAAEGIPASEALKNIKQRQVASQLMQSAEDYGVSKYVRNDRETTSGLDTNQNFWNWRKDKEDKKAKTALQLASTIVLGGAKVGDVKEFKNIQAGIKQEHDTTMDAYNRWLSGVDDGKQKVRYDNGVIKYKDENGQMVDVTEDANAFRDQMVYANERSKELEMVDEAAKRASGFNVIPDSVLKKAEKAQKEAEEATSSADTRVFGIKIVSSAGTGGAATIYTPEQRRRNGQAAYRAVLEETPQFRAYEKELETRMTGTTMGSDLFAFRDEKTIDNLSKTVESLISGLDLDKSMIPVQLNDGSQLNPDQLKELKGSMRASGVTFTGDPNSPVALVMRAFKDVKGKKTSGEDMIVKLPNTNIQAIAAENMDAEQTDYLRRASGLAAALNTPSRTFKHGNVTIKANTDDPRKGWKVKIGNKETTLYSFKSIFDYMDANK